jgi:hypothetical protein
MRGPQANRTSHVLSSTFHALRMTFITNLTRSGVSPKTAQTLARHSDINLTMGVYTRLGVMDQAAAVEALPPVPTSARPDSAQRVRATGTYGRTGALERAKKVPTMVPRGAENGAIQPTSAALRIAPDCTELAEEQRVVAAQEIAINAEESSASRTHSHQSASKLTQVPEEGVEPTLSCENWILSPARLPIPPLRQSVGK